MAVSWRPIAGNRPADIPNTVDQQMLQFASTVNRLAARVQFGFFQDDVIASQTGVVLDIAGYQVKERLLLRDAFIIGVGVYSTNARTAGTATFHPTINGVAITEAAILNATDTQSAVNIFAAVTANFVDSGQRVGVQVTTTAGWLPITANVIVEVLLLYTGED